jgi:hypothetical protein
LTDDQKCSLGSAKIADLAGCISQCCLELANALAIEPKADAALREKINRAIVVWLDLPGQLNLPRPSTFALAETISKIVEEEANG